VRGFVTSLKSIYPGAMRLPRRVPWACIGELEQVCSWIYADEEDLGTKTLAINRVSSTTPYTSKVIRSSYQHGMQWRRFLTPLIPP
jgi:hypothetical protein